MASVHLSVYNFDIVAIVHIALKFQFLKNLELFPFYGKASRRSEGCSKYMQITHTRKCSLIYFICLFYLQDIVCPWNSNVSIKL